VLAGPESPLVEPPEVSSPEVLAGPESPEVPTPVVPSSEVSVAPESPVALEDVVASCPPSLGSLSPQERLTATISNDHRVFHTKRDMTQRYDQE
jgi:hypothetical protein